MSQPRLLIFDVDGTLIDSQAHIYAAMGHAFSAVGLPLPSRAEILAGVGLSLPQLFWRLLPESSANEREALVAAYKDSFATLRLSSSGQELSPLFDGVRPVLDELQSRDDLLLALATGKSRRGLRHVLAMHALEDVFVTTQVADDHPSKPHPSMIEAALAETGVSVEHAVIVGDTSFDIEMGRAAGIATLGVAWGYHPVAELEAAGAHAILQDISDLPQALETIWSPA